MPCLSLFSGCFSSILPCEKTTGKGCWLSGQTTERTNVKISIITACRNGAPGLSTAMDSVLAQTHPDIEYIVVDGASTDGTPGLLRDYEPRFNGRMRWVSEPDRGMYDAINKGISMARGDVIGILNADDALASAGVIDRISGALADDAVQAVYGDIRFVAGTYGARLGELLAAPTARYYSSRFYHPKFVRFGYMPAHPSFYCRKACFEKFGGYKTDYEIAADHELLIRFLVKEKVPSVYLPEIFVVMRLGGKSTRSVNSTFVLNRENIRACRENGIYTNRVLQTGKYLFKIPGLVLKNGY